jgi:hypothetical protein
MLLLSAQLMYQIVPRAVAAFCVRKDKVAPSKQLPCTAQHQSAGLSQLHRASFRPRGSKALLIRIQSPSVNKPPGSDEDRVHFLTAAFAEPVRISPLLTIRATISHDSACGVIHCLENATTCHVMIHVLLRVSQHEMLPRLSPTKSLVSESEQKHQDSYRLPSL